MRRVRCCARPSSQAISGFELLTMYIMSTLSVECDSCLSKSSNATHIDSVTLARTRPIKSRHRSSRIAQSTSMSRIQGRLASSDHTSRGPSYLCLVARLILALAMVFNQLGAPFHHHHHDGVEAQLELGISHDQLGGGETRADSDEHLAGSHFTIAIRVEPTRIGQLPAIDPPDAADPLDTDLKLSAGLDPPAAPTPIARDRSAPAFRTYRSLPPAGRAPPLHA